MLLCTQRRRIRFIFFGGKKMKKFFVLFLLLGVTGSALATTDWWDGLTPAPTQTTRDRDWFNQANWVDSANVIIPGVPIATTEVKTHRTGAAPYNLTPIIATGSPYNPLELAAVASIINIGGVGALAEPYGQLTINSGTLTVGNGLRCGGSSSSRRSGQLFVNGGVINAPAYLAVGYGPGTASNVTGWLYMTAGTINAGSFDIGRVIATNGYADIDGGTIYATDFRMRPAGGTGTVSLDMSGGGGAGGAKIIITGDKTAAIYGYIDSGWIKTNGVAWEDYSLVTWDGTNTTIIPEPATLCLLGLGALSLIRRKR
jgi:hypothetical protein